MEPSLSGLKKPTTPGQDADALDDVIGIGKGTGDAVAENVNDYLYGRKR